jgi:hypothetical protein
VKSEITSSFVAVQQVIFDEGTDPFVSKSSCVSLIANDESQELSETMMMHMATTPACNASANS